MPFVLCRDENGNEFMVSQITIDRFPGDYKPVNAGEPAKPKSAPKRKRPSRAKPKNNVTATAADVTSGGSNLEGES